VQITRPCDYAVRVMIQLAMLEAVVRMRQKALARTAGVPETFLAKILQRLTRPGRVASPRGSAGGLALALPAVEISILDVLEIMEGPLRLNV
jgi:Rrf2 family protein